MPVHLVLLCMVHITCQVTTILGLVWAGLDWASEYTQRSMALFSINWSRLLILIFNVLFFFFFLVLLLFSLKIFWKSFHISIYSSFQSLYSSPHYEGSEHCIRLLLTGNLLYSFLLITNSTSVNILGHSSLDSHVFLRISTYCEIIGWKRWRIVVLHLLSQCISQSCLTLCDPMGCSMPDSLSFTTSWSLLTLMSI